jgi:uncharacterized protein
VTIVGDAGGRFPPYAFVPGGPWPHPTGSPRGHAAGRAPDVVMPIAGDDWSGSPAYCRGLALFNAGYYWEAHEAWEGLWHAHGRQGPTADLIKGLIKLAAAGVKVRQRQRHGVVTHARRAAALFATAREQEGRHQLGLDLDDWIATAQAIADKPPDDPQPPGVPVSRVFAFRIEPLADQADAAGGSEASRRRQAADPATASTARMTAPTTPCDPPSTNP